MELTGHRLARAVEHERTKEGPRFQRLSEPRYSPGGGRGQFGKPPHTRESAKKAITKKTIIESTGAVSEDLATADRDSHWVWTGSSQGRAGYRRGIIRLSKRRHAVHRIAYDLFRDDGCSPEYSLQRTCERELCINPWHHRQVINGFWKRGDGYAERMLEKYAHLTS